MSTESLGGLGANEQKLASLSTEAIETQPVVTADGLEIFFARAEGNSSDFYDVWHATRTDKIAPFGAPTKIDAVNTTGTADVPAWISADHCVLYLASSRAPGGSRDIYVATRGK